MRALEINLNIWYLCVHTFVVIYIPTYLLTLDKIFQTKLNLAFADFITEVS